MTPEEEKKLVSILSDKITTAKATAGTLSSQVDPNNRLISRTKLWMLKHDVNRLIDDFPDIFKNYSWAKKYPDYAFPPDDNQAVLDYFGVVFETATLEDLKHTIKLPNKQKK